MSRLSEAWRNRFGHSLTESAEGYLRGLVGEHGDDIVAFAQQTIVALEDGKLDSDEKFRLLSIAVKGFIAAAHLPLPIPGFAVDWFLHELIAKLRLGAGSSTQTAHSN